MRGFGGVFHQAMARKKQQAVRFGIDDSAESLLETIESFFEKGWTDGLPVVPPTEPAVQRMLATVDRDPTEVLGQVPPRLGVATVEGVADNAVMAGCRPEYFGVVLAAVEAMLEERLNLNGIQATTNPAAPLAIVSGPVVSELKINSGTNVFGHGHRSNATIGRAVRLVMTVIGGGYPETGDKSPLGQPGKFSFCIAESPTTPWEPLHVERGLAPEDSGVTMVGVGAPRAFTTSAEPLAFLRATAQEIAHMTHNLHFGGEVVLVMNPLVAHSMHQAGWDKDDIRYYFYEKARVRREEQIEGFEGGGITNPDNKVRWPMWLNVPDEDVKVPTLRRPENLIIVVAGGTQLPWSALCAGWGFFGGWSVTKPVRGG